MVHWMYLYQSSKSPYPAIKFGVSCFKNIAMASCDLQAEANSCWRHVIVQVKPVKWVFPHTLSRRPHFVLTPLSIVYSINERIIAQTEYRNKRNRLKGAPKKSKHGVCPPPVPNVMNRDDLNNIWADGSAQCGARGTTVPAKARRRYTCCMFHRIGGLKKKIRLKIMPLMGRKVMADLDLH